MTRPTDPTWPDPHEPNASWPVVSFWLANARQHHILTGLTGGQIEGTQRVGLRIPKGHAAIQDAQNSAVRQTKNGMSRWAQRQVLAGQYGWLDAQLTERPPSIIACWNGIKGHRRIAMELARKHGHATLFMEEAPIKGRIALDFHGVNFGNSLPRVIDVYDRWAANWGGDLRAWRSIGETLTARAPDRNRNVAQDDAKAVDGPYIFAPLQVPGDSQVTSYGDWISDIDALIDALFQASAALPDGWHMRVKEHPSSAVSFTDRLIAMQTDRFRIDNTTDTMAQIRGSKAVVTLNSAVGLESFYFDKPVIVLGHAFYAFDKLAHKVSGPDALSRLLTAPQRLTYSAHARSVFMSYLTEAYFPKELDVAEGRYQLADLIARDLRMAQFAADVADT